MNTIIAVAAGGAIGSVLRYAVNVAALRWIGAAFPWGTFLVNLVGCFLMGAVATAFTARAGWAPEWRAFFATGVLGGFTTFSAFSLDFVLLVQRGQPGPAALYLFGSVGLALLGLYLGMALARPIFA